MSQNQALQALRDKIDKIDEKIIKLLSQRMNIVSQVAELKKNNGEKFFIRSAREADMIKNLVAKNPDLQAPLIVNIWRKIITAANMAEQNLRIAIHNPNDVSDYEYLVKEYYSSYVPITSFDSISGVVSALEKNEAQIGIFALPSNDGEKEDAKENWWIALANNRLGLRVFAQIPFVEYCQNNNGKIHLVAVAIKEPEKSNDDNTLLYVEAAKGIEKSQILSAFKEQNLVAKILKSVKSQQSTSVTFYLATLDGFYLENDSAIKNFSKSRIKPFAKILGHYAKSIKISV
ncbi:MAG: hypothetical protein A2887_00035 [Alphaproteobacteria bacterium RIFCSPLOWO2_01_FULL_40_26]|nr:MAG: hypothetical protein A3D15_01240 [Alphaproteobacteria bacterium RIFCSPHIGHO2_02_FULL_40_34]OFW95163.1 MAG: hypothetical protein A2887_00035 [Alphaproteobacteria bacterium RIFCSPLOWO2_01_FULL_40_26]OFX10617.1 MAG: hypothetical protein A3H30_04310 [Alphaproteobacteria bacterium RIFCSPLOWO2_02_FULL_40_19]